jgi:hypothetical protein
MMQRFELTRFKWLTAILKARPFQPVLMLSTFLFFVIAILAGLFGTPAGSHNFASKRSGGNPLLNSNQLLAFF